MSLEKEKKESENKWLEGIHLTRDGMHLNIKRREKENEGMTK